MTHAPYDPRYESARATCQSERGWFFPPDAPAKPFDPRKSAAVSFILPLAGLLAFVGVCFWLAGKVSS